MRAEDEGQRDKECGPGAKGRNERALYLQVLSTEGLRCMISTYDLHSRPIGSMEVHAESCTRGLSIRLSTRRHQAENGDLVVRSVQGPQRRGTGLVRQWML